MDFQNALNIKTREEFIEFITMMEKDFTADMQGWENKTVDDFLHGLASWVEDMDGYFANNNLPAPSNINWGFMAMCLSAARIYE